VSDVKRYNFELRQWDETCGLIVQADDGKYVEHADYATLRQRVESAERENATLRQIVANCGNNLLYAEQIRRERDELRAQAEAMRKERADDTRRLDWLEQRVVEVRVPLMHGSRLMFAADAEDADGPSDLRFLVDAAMGEQQT